MFTDIASFTSLVEGLPADTIGPLVNEYLVGMTDIVFDHDGTLTNIVGDALITMFGAPTDQQDHAARAVACALACTVMPRRSARVGGTRGWVSERRASA